MAFLNQQEREELLNELKNMNFRQAKGKLHRIDPKGRMALFRNVQGVNQWVTRFDLKGLGTRVTLIEQPAGEPQENGRIKQKYQLREIIVEPTPENRT